MKCSEVIIAGIMTKAPVCCLPSDSVERVAQLMRQRNVGALPVVSGEGALLGIVTDRDIAVRLDAEGREAQVTPVEAAMTRNIAYCLSAGTVESALLLMAARQVRRLPVLDETGKVVGMLSKVDIARRLSDRAVDRKPWTMVAPALFAVGAGLAGAALMYIFDPVKGRGRRAVPKDKIVHFCREATAKTEGARNDIVNRTLGLIAERRARLESRPPDDVVLVERVRARLGKLVAHPHAVTVTAEKGVVTLSGCISRAEIRRLVAIAELIPGVTRVINRLEHSPQREPASLLTEDATADVAVTRSRMIA